MTARTPGPWHIGLRTAYAKCDVYGPSGEPVALADAVFTDLATAQANARLIAAAPDLLAALQDLLSWAETVPTDYAEDQLQRKARAAIRATS